MAVAIEAGCKKTSRQKASSLVIRAKEVKLRVRIWHVTILIGLWSMQSI